MNTQVDCHLYVHRDNTQAAFYHAIPLLNKTLTFWAYLKSLLQCENQQLKLLLHYQNKCSLFCVPPKYYIQIMDENLPIEETKHEILPSDPIMTNPLEGSIRPVSHINRKNHNINLLFSNVAFCHKS